MAGDNVTWASYFNAYFQTLDASEKKALCADLGVGRDTPRRWKNGKIIPRPRVLGKLLERFSGEQRETFRLLLQENEKTREHLQAIGEDISVLEQHLPSDVLLYALRLERDSPRVFWSLFSYIFSDVLARLDPMCHGMKISLARCTPPGPEQKTIQSLHEVIAMGTGIFAQDSPVLDNVQPQQVFLGRESFAGYALMKHSTTLFLPNTQEQTTVPNVQDARIRGAAISVIHHVREQGTMIAGALIVVSALPLEKNHQTLLEEYTDVLRLGIDPSWYYSIFDIDIKTFPPLASQQPFFSTFTRRVMEVQKKALPDMLTLEQAELLVLKEIERDLLFAVARDSEASSVSSAYQQERVQARGRDTK